MCIRDSDHVYDASTGTIRDPTAFERLYFWSKPIAWPPNMPTSNLHNYFVSEVAPDVIDGGSAVATHNGEITHTYSEFLGGNVLLQSAGRVSDPSIGACQRCERHGPCKSVERRRRGLTIMDGSR